MNRREILRTLAAGSTAGALAGGMVIMTTPSAATAMTPIERLAIDLRARYDRDTSGMSEAESDASADEFMALVDRIIRTEPQTPRDVAIQWLSDCLFDTSDNSEEFRERLIAMADMGGSADLPPPVVTEVPDYTPAPDPLLALVKEYRAGMTTYNASGDLPSEDDDALAAKTWRPAYDRLCDTPPAATTLAGSLAAIRLVVQEEEECDNASALAVPVLRAALAYLEGAR